MAVELVGIETCYRHEEEIPPRFKPCPYAAAAAAATVVAAKITTLFRRVRNSSCGNEQRAFIFS